ncbi:MAG: TetR/AcrR family transcriptional regulator [Bacteroidales bacterium]|nr:TetR/AcrR family transcriptional regulator [Bacteroidales bacterium]
MNQKNPRATLPGACLFSRFGIKSLTMDDIARELGISKKTLYQQVEDKKDLVKKVVEIDLRKREEYFAIIKNRSLNAIEEVFEVNKLVNKMIKETNPVREFDLQKYYPEIYDVVNQRRRERMYRAMKENLQKGKNEGLYRKDLKEEIISKLYIARMENMFHKDLETVIEFTSPKFIYEVFVYHIRGIASEKGIKFFEKNIYRLYPEEKS